MTTSDMIRKLCEKQNISLAELCRHHRILIRSCSVARYPLKKWSITAHLKVCGLKEPLIDWTKFFENYVI